MGVRCDVSLSCVLGYVCWNEEGSESRGGVGGEFLVEFRGELSGV